MGKVSSQAISLWLIHQLEGSQWESLPILIEKTLKVKLPSMSNDSLADMAEEHLPYVANILRDILEDERKTGTAPRFELDEEDPPYIRSMVSDASITILKRLREVKPDEFEFICAELIKSFGAIASSNGGSDDGGIDFVGLDLLVHKDIKNMPTTSKFLILGQAKRYNNKNSVTLNELRQFVGSCKAKVKDYIVQGKVGPLTPIIYAFWTTSQFDAKARDYAHQMGIWFMDGYSFSCHIEQFSIGLPPPIEETIKTEVLEFGINDKET